LLHEFNPNAKTMALLVDPAYPAVATVDSSGVSAAAQSLGIELHVLTASTERDFDAHGRSGAHPAHHRGRHQGAVRTHQLARGPEIDSILASPIR
jgi:hypothetical protein